MEKKSMIGSKQEKVTAQGAVSSYTAHQANSRFWDTIGSEFLGVVSLPHYGAFLSEEKLGLLGNLHGQRVLEIGCGNGRSLEYLAQKGALELWGMDLSRSQLARAQKYLDACSVQAKLIASPMEEECGIPHEYFDLICSVYAIGWTTDLNKTFYKINSYLKQDGIFLFSWSHPIHKCVSIEDGKLVFSNSYFDETWYSTSVKGQEFLLSNRKLSTYINSLAKNGFLVECLIEDNDEDMLLHSGQTDFAQKAGMLPVTFVIKARKIS